MTAKKVVPAKKPKLTDAEQVAAWMDDLDSPLKPGIALLREIIRHADPRIAERIKWNAPSYHLGGTDIVTFGPRRGDKILLVFHHPAIVQVTSDLLEGDFKDRRLAWFSTMQEIEDGRKDLTRIVKAVVGKIDTGG
jgi:uncharacterized protein YdhG (YjbR/CyaY superfamily)